jgi:hypothetical protein
MTKSALACGVLLVSALNDFLERQATAIREGLPRARVVKLTRVFVASLP